MRGADNLASQAGAVEYLFSLGGGLHMADRITRRDLTRFGFSQPGGAKPVRV